MSDVDQWLSDFDSALRANDSAGAAALFHDESFWRDLVAFTWNIKTVEGPDEIEAMLDFALPHVQPSGWHTTDEPTSEDGITTAWIAFETAAGRGNGLLRLRDFFQRMHPPALANTLAAWCAALASVVYFSALASAVVLYPLVINVLLAITAPVTTVLLARAALLRKRAVGAAVPPPLGERRNARPNSGKPSV